MNQTKQIYCSREEAAEIWRCSKRTIDRNIRDGKIRCRKLDTAKGGRVLIYVESLYENTNNEN